MYLTPRLKAIANFVDYMAVTADIGTDHAYIPIFLISESICKTVYATDVNVGPLKIANRQIEKYGYKNNITTLLGEGLNPIKGLNVDNIIISGMGGVLIQEIISNNLDIASSAGKLILQPMTAQYELRKYLLNNGFRIVEEDLTKEDRRIYQVIVAKKGLEEEQSEMCYHFGPRLIQDKHPLLIELIEAKERELLKIIKACTSENTVNAIYKRQECEDLLVQIEEVKNCLQSVRR